MVSPDERRARARPIWALRCDIVSPVPLDPTERVTARVVDARGVSWELEDKLAIFRSAEGGSDGVRCVVLGVEHDERGRTVCRVSTREPDHVATTAETDELSVLAAELRPLGSLGGDAPSGWLDIDVIQHSIALVVGLLPPSTSFTAAKGHYWTVSPIGDFTLAIVDLLAREGQLVRQPDDETVLRWSA